MFYRDAPPLLQTVTDGLKVCGKLPRLTSIPTCLSRGLQIRGALRPLPVLPLTKLRHSARPQPELLLLLLLKNRRGPLRHPLHLWVSSSFSSADEMQLPPLNLGAPAAASGSLPGPAKWGAKLFKQSYPKDNSGFCISILEAVVSAGPSYF